MKRIAMLVTLFITTFSVSSLPINCHQSGGANDALSKKMAEMELEPDEKTIFKDESGKIISSNEFNKFLEKNSQTYTARRVVKDGRVEEMKLAKLSRMEIEMRRKMSESMKEADLMKKESIGKPAAVFTAKTLDGKSVSLTDLKGKIVVLNFWFIACAPCVAEMPDLNNLVEKYRSRDDIVFLAPASDDAKHLSDFFQKHSFKYQIIPSAHDF